MLEMYKFYIIDYAIRRFYDMYMYNWRIEESSLRANKLLQLVRESLELFFFSFFFLRKIILPWILFCAILQLCYLKCFVKIYEIRII